MILQPGGVRSIGAKKSAANFVVLPADHAPEPGKETLRQIGVDAVAAVGVGMVDAVNIEPRLESMCRSQWAISSAEIVDPGVSDPLPGEAHTLGLALPECSREG